MLASGTKNATCSGAPGGLWRSILRLSQAGLFWARAL